MKTAHGDGMAPRMHRCGRCPEEFTSAAALWRHRKKEHNWTQGSKLPCPKCEKTFCLKKALR
jgi:uncharacterized C2H2 Zn-finger protein